MPAFLQNKLSTCPGSFQLAVKSAWAKSYFLSSSKEQLLQQSITKSSLIGLNISQTRGAIDISAIATDYDTASQVQVNLADPHSKIFLAKQTLSASTVPTKKCS